jgi:hypothetical protein
MPALVPGAVGDGEADIYLHDAGMMANHIEGRDRWDLLVQGAKAANWVIIPVGCPTCQARWKNSRRGSTAKWRSSRLVRTS